MDTNNDIPGPAIRWDNRYDTSEYFFGVRPNDFLAEVIHRVPAGDALCLADGEGRNGVFLAEHGFNVLSIDSSAVGLEKARRLATERNVTIQTEQADLFDWDPGQACWDLVVVIFFHMPPDRRVDVHQKVVDALTPGGFLIHEAYTPKQLAFRTGGPPVVEMLQTLASVTEDYAGLDFLHAEEREREVIEGVGHTGHASVVQVLARKPE